MKLRNVCILTISPIVVGVVWSDQDLVERVLCTVGLAVLSYILLEWVLGTALGQWWVGTKIHKSLTAWFTHATDGIYELVQRKSN